MEKCNFFAVVDFGPRKRFLDGGVQVADEPIGGVGVASFQEVVGKDEVTSKN